VKKERRKGSDFRTDLGEGNSGGTVPLFQKLFTFHLFQLEALSERENAKLHALYVMRMGRIEDKRAESFNLKKERGKRGAKHRFFDIGTKTNFMEIRGSQGVGGAERRVTCDP